MAFQLSPGVLVTEKDLTTIVPAVATSAGGMAGTFAWGPAEEVILIDSENKLKATYHEPDANTYEWWFTAANFLQYGNNLQCVRAIDSSARNAVVQGTAVQIKNRADYDANYGNGQGSVGGWAAKYPGSIGNSLLVGISDATASQAVFDAWAYSAEFDGRPGTSTYASNRGATNDEIHVIVVDQDGLFTGTAGTVLERFPYLSKAADARKDNGEGNFYVDVVNNQSKYVYWMDHSQSNWGTNANVGGTGTAYTVQVHEARPLITGVDGNASVTDGNWQTAATKLKEPDEVDIQLFLCGPGRPHSGASAGYTNWTWALSNIAEYRKDCVVFVSPEYSDVVNQAG